MNYYNEYDPKTAAWLRELIKTGEIAPGEVDERSICDVQPDDLVGFAQCHFFAGIAGWSAALRLAGVPDDFPVWTGSCPCQPFSGAGKQLGTADERHLWPEMLRLIEARRPALVFGEQVASAEVVGSGDEAAFVVAVQGGDFARANKLARRLAQSRNFSYQPRWVDGVRAGLEGADYTFGAAVLGAHSIGAPHIRQRIWWMAYADSEHREWRIGDGDAAGSARLADSRTARWLADMQRAGLEGLAGDGDDRDESGRLGADAAGSTAEGGRAGWLGQPNGAGWEPGRLAAEAARYGSSTESAGGAGERLGDATSQRRDAGGDDDNAAIRRNEPTGVAGAWSDFDLIPCRDGKARRVERGTFPLVAGVLRDLVPGGDPSVAEAQATSEGRVARLRGYGNSIVPQVAAAFIRASLMSVTSA